MTLELCIDTSAGASVAVVVDGRARARVHNESPRHHAENLAALIREAGELAGLDQKLRNNAWTRICVGTGPAPFTGLRAGLVTATTLGQAWGVPVYGVSSLAAIGRQNLDLLPPETRVMTVTDARRHEVYWASYRADGPDGLIVDRAPQVSFPADLSADLLREPALVVGPGAPLLQASLDLQPGPTAGVDPAVLSRLVAAALAADPQTVLPVEPLYLRRPDIHGVPGGDPR